MSHHVLESRPLGETGLNVTRLGFGAMEVRGERIWDGRPVTDEQAATILGAVVDAGITFIDTANDYGRSEAYLGQFLADRREEFALATKCGCTMVPAGDHDETPHSWDRDHLLGNIDDSLAKLRTDHVDLLQLHNPDVRAAEEHGWSTPCARSRTRAKPATSASPPPPRTWRHTSSGVSSRRSRSPTRRWNVVTRTSSRRPTEAGAGTIVRGGVARGEPGQGLGGKDAWELWERANLDDLLGEAESRTAWQLRFTLSHPAVDTIIAGTLNPKHLAENLAAAQAGPLPDDVYAEAKRRLDEAGESPEQ